MTYVNITAAEMRAFLRPDKGWREFDGSTKEYVYVCPLRFLPNNTVLKVWTGISKSSAQSRRKGDDAIRVCVVEDHGHGRGVMATSHVKRVTNWRANLINRITETISDLKRRIPQTPPQPKRMNENEIKQRLMKLTSDLSPENLTCDGELSQRDWRAKEKRILAEWAELETQLGRKVTQNEVWDWYNEESAEPPFDGEEEYDRQQDEIERRWRAGPLI